VLCKLCKYLRAIFHIKRQAQGAWRAEAEIKIAGGAAKTFANCDQSSWPKKQIGS